MKTPAFFKSLEDAEKEMSEPGVTVTTPEDVELSIV
jgi:hypothetical protein